jgi:microsomal dipeptidase-like Zn-dependent dipeptidase
MAVESDLKRIAPELAKRSYSEADIQKILGLNFLRVFDQVWTQSVV